MSGIFLRFGGLMGHLVDLLIRVRLDRGPRASPPDQLVDLLT
jgi:hypothetical protein